MDVGTGFPLASTAKSTTALLSAGFPAPFTSIVISFVILAPTANDVTARFVQIKLPAPEPSGGIVALTNWRYAALKLSSIGRVGMTVVPVFLRIILKTTFLLILTGEFVGESNVLVTVKAGCVFD